MRWIRTLLPLVVLFVGFALGDAQGGEERPGLIDSAPADAACELSQHGLPGPTCYQVPVPSFEIATCFDNPVLSLPFVADTTDVGLFPSFDSLIPSIPLLLQNPPDAVICRHRCRASWPVTSVGRLTWLQRFLF